MNQVKKGIRKKGIVLEALPNLQFRVNLDDGGEALVYLAGKLKLYHIRVLPGERVLVEISPYDSKKGRIIYRER